MTGIEKGILQNPGKFSIKWKVDRFFVDCQQKGDYYTSPRVPIEYAMNNNNNVTKSYIKVYPQGDMFAPSEAVSLYLCFESKIGVAGKYRLAIMNLKSNAPSTSKAEGNLNDQLTSFGWSNFLNKSSFNLKYGTLINDTVVILCDIEIHAPDQEVTGSFYGYDKWLDKTANKCSDFEDLLESGHFSDVTFTVQDKTINVHKAILSCRSPVFKAMFEHDMKENKQNSVDIKDINHDVMKELFRFIYSGKVNNIEKIANELLIAADKYQVIELKALCEKTIYDTVTVDNAVEYLKLTEMCDTIDLKKLLIKYVAAHYKEVDQMPGLADLNGRVMYEIIQAIAKQG